MNDSNDQQALIDRLAKLRANNPFRGKTDEEKRARLEELRNNPLFGKKAGESKAEAPPDATIETPSEPTNLSQNIYDKLYPYFTELLNEVATAEKPLLLEADFYIKLAEAIRVQNWNDTCSIKLWILINQLKSPLAKNTSNKWTDLYKTANDIYKKVRTERRTEDEINSFTCPRGQWIDYDQKTKPRPTVENCIVALRFILEDDKIELKYDTWKRTVVVVSPPRPTSPADVYDHSAENTDVVIKEWQNRIHVEHNITFSDEAMRIARFRIAVKNQIHSQKDYYKSLKWDSVSRIALLATEIFKLQGTALELEVLRMQLIASVRRVLMPGTKYDLVPCLISKQGVMKSFGLSVLYRTHDVLDEDILDLNSQKQSEQMRNGKNCLELPDSFGRNADYDTIKAFVSRRHDHGRDAYGRVEDIKDVGRTYVIWHTGNNPKLFRDPTGNRRFIPMPRNCCVKCETIFGPKLLHWRRKVDWHIMKRCAKKVFLLKRVTRNSQISCWIPNFTMMQRSFKVMPGSKMNIKRWWQMSFFETLFILNIIILRFMFYLRIYDCIWVFTLANGTEPHKKYLKQCKI